MIAIRCIVHWHGSECWVYRWLPGQEERVIDALSGQVESQTISLKSALNIASVIADTFGLVPCDDGDCDADES